MRNKIYGWIHVKSSYQINQNVWRLRLRFNSLLFLKYVIKCLQSTVCLKLIELLLSLWQCHICVNFEWINSIRKILDFRDINEGHNAISSISGWNIISYSRNHMISFRFNKRNRRILTFFIYCLSSQLF